MSRKEAIGVFDSGIGGLTVVSRFMEALPNEKIVYFGDTLRVPYGSKPPETITRLSVEASDFLMSKNVKAIVVACNTITVTCLDVLKKRLPVPVFGIIESGAQAVSDAFADNKKKPKIGVIATERTVNSGKYERLIEDKLNGAHVISKACPLFVPLAEEGLTEGTLVKNAVAHYLAELKDAEISALLLGCTHYPLLIKEIREFLGEGVCVIDPASTLAELVRAYFEENGLSRQDTAPPDHEFYLSDASSGFAAVSRLALLKEYGFSVL